MEEPVMEEPVMEEPVVMRASGIMRLSAEQSGETSAREPLHPVHCEGEHGMTRREGGGGGGRRCGGSGRVVFRRE